MVDTNTTSQVDQTDQKLETDMVPYMVGRVSALLVLTLDTNYSQSDLNR